MILIRSRGGAHLGFLGRRRWRRRGGCAQTVNDGGDPVVFGDGRMVGEVRLDEVI
jgi:hypothetical protein